MAFWGRERWLAEGGTGIGDCPVKPWNVDRVEAAGYRLSVGHEHFVNNDGSSTVAKLEHEDTFVVKPGQFAFILTKEKVSISKSAIGFISIRASIKFKGLVNVSGFQVDPGFSGNLVFAVFNAGPRHINLREGQEIFSLWIADLDKTVSDEFEGTGKIPNKLDKIPIDVVNDIAGDAMTAYQLSDRLAKVEDYNRTIKLWVTRVFYALVLIGTLLGAAYKDDLEKLISTGGKSTIEQQDAPALEGPQKDVGEGAAGQDG
ncbi:dCTP deaminase domain-containing protein [Tritonibacter mobilis]|uniref:Uncharacterized protein n=1 Tax=Tritonibacter mobilis F1926 TaxID=1265309 RepID=A0A1B1A5P1_9RHOB|nr:deoxycytidine deaminase-like protein [Tritonibacter mobilis]ANP41889.1 hypothetical protein K529_014020 [Tritonibacter mobilis F1926]